MARRNSASASGVSPEPPASALTSIQPRCAHVARRGCPGLPKSPRGQYWSMSGCQAGGGRGDPPGCQGRHEGFVGLNPPTGNEPLTINWLLTINRLLTKGNMVIRLACRLRPEFRQATFYQEAWRSPSMPGWATLPTPGAAAFQSPRHQRV